ncbi:MAG: tetratricopeptide repeat protein [Deltaproteobacteria bacterium]|nr:tetratricopeptide repeat protein [Deltaproteobacteria bacterium]
MKAPEAPPPTTSAAGLEAMLEGRAGDAEKLLAAALQRAARQYPEEPAHAAAMVDLAEFYRSQARYEEAEPLFTRAITMLERGGEAQRARLARPLNSLALVYRAQGLYDRAEPLCRRALSILEAVHGAEHPSTAAALGNLLAVYLAQGRYGDAGPLFRRSVELKERVLGPRHPALAGSFSNYAAFLRKTEGEAEAAAWEARARKLRSADR